jgi:hypothetical protein
VQICLSSISGRQVKSFVLNGDLKFYVTKFSCECETRSMQARLMQCNHTRYKIYSQVI